MEKTILAVIILLASLSAVSAKDRVIANPVYEFSKTGIMHITKINICCEDENDNPILFGISLDPKTKPLSKEIPAEVTLWIENEMIQSGRKTLMDFEAGEFFCSDTARLIGYIQGYDPRAGFTTGIVYARNQISREDFPVVIQVYEDGRFEGVIPLNYPEYTNVAFNGNNFSFYIQPGQTLSMLLDWEEFRMADRLRNERYKFKDVRFQGVTADINSELTAFQAKLSNIPVGKIYEGIEGKNPNEFKAFYDECMSEYTQTYQRLLETERLSGQSKDILQNDYQVRYASYLFEYEMRSRRSNQTIPLDFYDFLQDIPMDNQELLSTQSFAVFINRLEYSQPMSDASAKFNRSIIPPEITFFQYLFEELKLMKTPEDEVFLLLQDSLNTILSSQDMSETEENDFINTYMTFSQEFQKRYEQHIADYGRKYNQLTPSERELGAWQMKDSVFTNELKLKQGIVNDITKIRSLDFLFESIFKDNKEVAWNYLTALTSNIPEAFLKKEADRLFLKNFPSEQRMAYELPDNYEAKIFKELIDPFKGKIILVDFWATTCGPCVHNIREHKALREKYRDSPDMAFVFITSDYESPLSAYENFVKEQELIHTYLISADQYRYLRQLFRFNGIPRYVLVDREGKIIDDNFSIYQTELRLKELMRE